MCRSKASINQRTTGGGALKTGRLDEKYKGYKPVVDIEEGLFFSFKKKRAVGLQTPFICTKVGYDKRVHVLHTI